ncbi:MAG: thiamine pyrophosphate-binding protein, partial [Burkholderiaceae bacterium]|nr:thiamine pyrophosphate-binding protein [Burkholderiaceae bacterium]
MMAERLGAHSLVDAFKAQGVNSIFTLSGNHIMPIFDAVIDEPIKLIHTRHEAATVHMADAYARLSGKVGIAMVTGGPGHANAVSALYTAAMAESPVVLLSGHAPLNQLGKGAFQEMSQADIAAPLCKASWTCAGPQYLAADFQLACAIAQSGRPGPVHLSLPADALESPLPNASATPSPSAPKLTLNAPLTSEKAQSIVTQLRAAQKPVVIVGPRGCYRYAKQLHALSKALGVPVIATESPRGVGDPSLGAFAEVLAQSDCVLLLEKRLDFTLKFGNAPTFKADARFMQIDSEATELKRSENALGSRLEMALQADLSSSMDALLHAAQSGPTKPQDASWLPWVNEAIAYRPNTWSTATSKTPNHTHPGRAMLALQAILDSHPDSVLVIDGGEIGQWAQACLHAPNRVINGVAGSIGAALPFATAAAFTKPGVPVVAVMGDGTFGFHSSELDTAVRYQLPFIGVVGNDACWNAEY